MSMVRFRFFLVVLCFLSANAFAAVFQLNFEGLQHNESVLNFYNGGVGSLGSSGTNYGVSFSAGSTAIIDSDAPGGTGNFANEPSPSTAMFWTAGPSVIMNVAAGFGTGVSFYYSSSASVTVTAYDGLNGTGAALATVTGPAQSSGNACVGDPNGTYCNWSQLGIAFSGTALSVVFTGTANNVAFDNITFGSPTPVIATTPTAVPTLSQWGLIFLASLMAMFGIAATRRRQD